MSFSIFFNVITIFSMKKKEIEKIGLKVNLYFFFMGIFNEMYGEINGV